MTSKEEQEKEEWDRLWARGFFESNQGGSFSEEVLELS